MSDIDDAQKECLSFLKKTNAGKVIYIGIAIENLLNLVLNNNLENIEIFSMMSTPIDRIKKKILFFHPKFEDKIEEIIFHDTFPTKNNTYRVIVYFPDPAISPTDFKEHLNKFKNICQSNGYVLICTKPIVRTTFSMFSVKIDLNELIENLFGKNSINETKEFGEFIFFRVKT